MLCLRISKLFIIDGAQEVTRYQANLIKVLLVVQQVAFNVNILSASDNIEATIINTNCHLYHLQQLAW
ncbi:MAG: hypothetical protein JWR61_3268 [Ferruginibacter sp.]|nr:hypothetical protein [Ferruginibacter sp.]